MTAPRRRPLRPGVDRLEDRRLLSGGDPPGPLPRETPSYDPQIAEIAVQKEKAKGGVTIEREQTFIRGTVIPARLFGDQKGKGALVVVGKTAWSLNLDETKGFTGWGKRLSHRQVTATGTAKIKIDPNGKIKREFKVTWIEPLKIGFTPQLQANRSLVYRLKDAPPKAKG